jgi:hypothetical protein
VPDGECAVHPPAGRNGEQRLKDEAALWKAGVRDFQSPRAEAAAAPQDNVEVENPGAPAAARSAAELALEPL